MLIFKFKDFNAGDILLLFIRDVAKELKKSNEWFVNEDNNNETFSKHSRNYLSRKSIERCWYKCTWQDLVNGARSRSYSHKRNHVEANTNSSRERKACNHVRVIHVECRYLQNESNKTLESNLLQTLRYQPHLFNHLATFTISRCARNVWKNREGNSNHFELNQFLFVKETLLSLLFSFHCCCWCC